MGSIEDMLRWMKTAAAIADAERRLGERAANVCFPQSSGGSRVNASYDRGNMAASPTNTPYKSQVAPAPDEGVDHPFHYDRMPIDPVTFIMANKLPFDVANVIKYVCRQDAKDGLKDLKKARRYIEIMIERLDRERRVAAGENPQEVWKVKL